MTPYENFRYIARRAPGLGGTSVYGYAITATGGGSAGRRVIDSGGANYPTAAAAVAAGRARAAEIRANERTNPRYRGRRTLAGSLEQ